MYFVAKTLALSTLLVGANTALAGNHDPLAIIPLLGDAKLTLIQGIELAEASYGPATSAKFEVGDDGKLVLSVYNVPEGLNVEPEAATLSEVGIDPTVDGPTLAVEVFADKEHLTRAAAHMTIFRMSKLSLVNVLKRAVRVTNATPIDVRNPTVANKRPVAEVVMFDKSGPFSVVVDLLDGRVRRAKR